MATSKCAACGRTSFEIKEVSPNGSQFRLYFVQCASCGVPVSVIEYNNIGALLQKQSEAIKRIAYQVGTHVDL